ncbi:hypothetical protein [Pseudorhizobium pelagicum]|uniref:hypothetical protein n=1 Tax=Pseudorhizobium pelagicum TaxID=1509405 RepID=UPI00111156B7|nr:hypothetical protein [Pseudorhizobium pelagicum]
MTTLLTIQSEGPSGAQSFNRRRSVVARRGGLSDSLHACSLHTHALRPLPAAHRLAAPCTPAGRCRDLITTLGKKAKNRCRDDRTGTGHPDIYVCAV